MTTATQVETAVDKLVLNSDRMDRIVNGGPDEVVTTDAGPVKSFSGLQAEAEIQIDAATDAADRAETAADTATGAVPDIIAARDQALTAFDSNATSKSTAFDSNAATKTTDFNAIAASAAADVSAADPVYRGADALRRAASAAISNSGNRAAQQTDGTWKSTNTPWAVEFDFPVVSGSTQYIDWLDAAGAVLTIEERSASAQTVAPVTPPLVAGRRRQTIVTNASTTIIRAKVAGSANNTTFTTPSVTVNRPTTLPTDGPLLSLLMDRLLTTEGAAIGAGFYSPTASTGTIPTLSGNTLSAVTGTNFTARYGLTTPPTADFVALATLGGTNYALQSLTITPVLTDGTSGTAISVRAVRWGDDTKRFIVPIPHRVGGVQIAYLLLTGNTTSGGGPNVSPGGTLTVTLEAFSTANVPGFRSVPTIIAKAIADAGTTTLATAAAATSNAIEDAYKRNVYRARESDVAGLRVWLSQMVQFFFSPAKGLDANAGSNAWAPKKLFQNAVGAITAGRSLLFARGERHYTGFVQYHPSDVHYGAFGRSNDNRRTTTGKRVDNRAVLDARKNMSGLTWTSSTVSGQTIWTTTVTLDFTTVMSGLNLTSTQLPLWDGRSSAVGVPLDVKYGGGTITANKALVAATPGSGTINKNGSTVADPRLDSNGTVYDVTVRLADDANPNTLPILISQRDAPMFISGGSITDATLMGGSGKDGNDTVPSTTDGAFTEITNCRFLSVAHGNVGPFKPLGSNWFIGSPAPAGAAGPGGYAVLGRASQGSGGLHIFAPGNYQDRDIEMHATQYIANHTNGVYGHISATPGGYRNGYFADLVVGNSTTALAFDSAPPPGTLCTGTLTIDRLYSGPWTDPETGISYDGCDVCLAPGYASTVYVNSVEHIGSLYTAQNNGGFMRANSQGIYHIGRWGGFTHKPRHKIAVPGGTVIQGVTFDSNAGNALVSNTYYAGSMPEVHFYGGRDLSPVGKKAQIGAGAASGGLANGWDIELHLHSAFLDRYGNPGPEIPGVYGCLTPASGVNAPKRLFVYANQTFGIKDLNRAGIIAYYLGLGKVQGTAVNPLLAIDGTTPADFYIDPETWIVSVAGLIIDVPESLKA